jgi:hypothetical protein
MARQHHDEQDVAAATGERAMKREDSPFQRHWLYYVTLKYAVIAAAVFVSLYVLYRLHSG